MVPGSLRYHTAGAMISCRWMDNWHPSFEYPTQTCELIYTPNALEALKAQLRSVP
jgi:hypothetical protein